MEPLEYEELSDVISKIVVDSEEEPYGAPLSRVSVDAFIHQNS
jgi:hypothetical protein